MTPPSSTKLPNTSPQLVIEVRPQPVKASGFDYWSLGPSLITVASALIGWAIVERFARARERRTELKAMVAAFVDAVADISTSAVEFYRLDGGNPQARALAATLRTRIGTLAEFIAALRSSGLSLASADTDLKLFRQAVTGNTFESLNRAASPIDAVIFVTVAQAGAALSRNVQLALFRSAIIKSTRWSKASTKASVSIAAKREPGIRNP